MRASGEGKQRGCGAGENEVATLTAGETHDRATDATQRRTARTGNRRLASIRLASTHLPGYVWYQPPPYNTLAILALVLGVMVLPPLGIYFGHKAQEQIAQTGERGVELAKAGVVVGWILTSLYGVLFCGVCLLASQAPR